MIRVTKGKAPDKLTGKKCKQCIAEVCAAPETHDHKDGYYAHCSVREALAQCYGNKCAYCEGPVGVQSSARIDHYRPKKKIKDITTHLGYFWLTYEWTNLVQACETCNGEKSNQFPLGDEHTRVSMDIRHGNKLPNIEWTDPKGVKLGKEKRLLLNPEWDEVETHFTFTSDGKIHASTTQGITSIRVYGLNRDGLVVARRQKWEKYQNRLNRYIDDYTNQFGEAQAKDIFVSNVEELFFQILNEDADLLHRYHREYSQFCFFMVSRFDEFVGSTPFCGEIIETTNKVKKKYKIL